jgi:hypothetical protein
MIDLARKDATLAMFDEALERVESMETEDMAELFYQLNAIMNRATPLHDKLKANLKTRIDEGGKDERGHSYIAGRTGSAKVERRVKITLKENAVERLDALGLLDEFPYKEDYDMMCTLLEQLPVDIVSYAKPDVTVETLTELVEDGIIDPAVAREVLDVREFYAVKSMELNELEDG